MQTQRLIAGSPHLLLEDTFVLNKPKKKKKSSPNKLQSDFVSEQPSKVMKLNSMSKKTLLPRMLKATRVERFPFHVSTT